jgi:hypothetical protein
MPGKEQLFAAYRLIVADNSMDVLYVETTQPLIRDVL